MVYRNHITRFKWVSVCVGALLVGCCAVTAHAQFDPSLTDQQIEEMCRVMTEEQKQSMVTNPAAVSLQALMATAPLAAEQAPEGILYPLPADRTPDDGNPSNDGGWYLVDFCTAGATGNGPAQPPDCHANDDDSAVYSLPFTFTFYGLPQTTIYINNNGNISFGSLFSTFTAYGFPVSGFPMIAPFWADVDTRNNYGHVWYKYIPEKKTFVVTWDAVGYYNVHGDKRNTFQLAISDGTNPDFGLGNNVCFSYNDMVWTTGDASNGSGGFGGVPATVGVNRGNGLAFAQIGRFGHPGIDYDGPGGQIDGVDYLDGQRFFFNVSGVTNVPPVAQGMPLDGKVRWESGIPATLTIRFSGPELDQITTSSFQDNNGIVARGCQIATSAGNPATVTFNWTPTSLDVGTYQIVLTATDNGLPPGTTTVSLYIEVFSPVKANPGGPYQGLEGSPVSFDGSLSTGSSGTLVYDWNWGDGTVSLNAEPQPTHVYADNGVYAVSLSVSDATGAFDTAYTTANIANVAPVVQMPVLDKFIVPVKTLISISALFADAGVHDTHTAFCNLEDDSISHPGSVTETNGCGTAGASSQDIGHVDYELPGIYSITMTVIDKDGGVGQSPPATVVVYDPSAGFVTGGGWIDSPQGAYKPDLSLSGKAHFGFVSKYQKGKTVPTGETEFQFTVADLNFHSSSYEWMIVNQAGTNAQFKGSGTINGQGNYWFMIWAGDNGSRDTFRIRIWTETGDSNVDIYDNCTNQVIGGGSIIIHK